MLEQIIAKYQSILQYYEQTWKKNIPGTYIFFRKTATDKFVLLPSQIPFRNEKMKYLNEKGKHVDFQMIDKEYPYI